MKMRVVIGGSGSNIESSNSQYHITFCGCRVPFLSLCSSVREVVNFVCVDVRGLSFGRLELREEARPV